VMEGGRLKEDRARSSLSCAGLTDVRAT